MTEVRFSFHVLAGSLLKFVVVLGQFGISHDKVLFLLFGKFDFFRDQVEFCDWDCVAEFFVHVLHLDDGLFFPFAEGVDSPVELAVFLCDVVIVSVVLSLQQSPLLLKALVFPCQAQQVDLINTVLFGELNNARCLITLLQCRLGLLKHLDALLLLEDLVS